MIRLVGGTLSVHPLELLPFFTTFLVDKDLSSSDFVLMLLDNSLISFPVLGYPFVRVEQKIEIFAIFRYLTCLAKKTVIINSSYLALYSL